VTDTGHHQHAVNTSKSLLALVDVELGMGQRIIIVAAFVNPIHHLQRVQRASHIVHLERRLPPPILTMRDDYRRAGAARLAASVVRVDG